MLQEIAGFFLQMTQMNIIVIFAIIALFVFLAYSVLKVLTKAIFFGVLGAAFPFAANYFGFGFPTNISSLLLFAMFGMGGYFLYSLLSGGVKMFKFITSPFRSLFKTNKEKIIIREQPPEEEKKKR